VPAIAFLRLFLFAMPLTFNVHTIDGFAREYGGRLGTLLNVFQMFMGEGRHCRVAGGG